MWVIRPQIHLEGSLKRIRSQNLGFVESQPQKSTKRESVPCEPLKGITHGYDATTNSKGEKKECQCWLEGKDISE